MGYESLLGSLLKNGQLEANKYAWGPKKTNIRSIIILKISPCYHIQRQVCLSVYSSLSVGSLCLFIFGSGSTES